ncbi:MAG: DUF4118 domain-containing protein, partial [Actinobacteria bacterium]|nr:DUF4118 domain-containing protein [Actinomycetota bacterium]
MKTPAGQRPLPSYYALPVGYAVMLGIGAVTAALNGLLPGAGLLAVLGVVVAVLSAVSDVRAAPLLGGLGWLMAVGFSRPPYGQLQMTGPLAERAALTMAACSLVAAGCGLLVRRIMRSYTVQIFRRSSGRSSGRTAGQWLALGFSGTRPPAAGSSAAASHNPGPSPGLAEAQPGLGIRRQVASVLLAAMALPAITAALTAARPHLSLEDDLLIYLVTVVAITMAGGFWPAVLAAISASVLLNWYFTPPLHTFTIQKPQDLLALLLFVTVAMAVSSVVHLAARRAAQATRSGAEAASLLALAQTVLGGEDAAGTVLRHLVDTLGGRAELRERAGDQWVRVAAADGEAWTGAERLIGERLDGARIGDESVPGDRQDGTGRPAGEAVVRVPVRDELELLVAGPARLAAPRLLDGFAAQAAAALDRE